MNTSLESPWWAVLLRGLAAIAFGVLLLVWPDLTLNVFIYVFAVFAIVFGASAGISALLGVRKDGGWGLQSIVGLLGIAAGVVALLYPGVTAVIMLYLVAAWAIASGGAEIATAMNMRASRGFAWLLVLIGVISVAFGVAAFVWPGETILGILWLVGAYALVSGMLIFIGSFLLFLQQQKQSTQKQKTAVGPASAPQPTTVTPPRDKVPAGGAATVGAPAGKPAEKPLEAPAKKADEPAAEKPAEPAAEKPAEPPAKKPSEKAPEAPAQKPAEPAAEKPAEPAAEKPAEPAAKKADEAPAEKPPEPAAEKPAEAPAEKAAEPAAEAPVPPPMVGVADELTKLAALRDKGVLTDEEFAAQKAHLLRRS